MRPARAVVAGLLAAVSLAVVPTGDAGQPATAPRALPAPVGEWVAGDLHVHTTYSHDSYGGPGDDNTGEDEFYTAGHTVEQVFRHAQTRGLDFLAVSDHNDVRSQSDSGFGRFGVIGLPAYENSLDGHAQMLGAERIYDAGDGSSVAVHAMAEELRADGGAFQVNHPTTPDGGLDWSYAYDVVPDSVETWNITSVWQPPMPSANDDDGNIAYWEGWLDRGHAVAAVGASDSHWVSTSAAQGPGQPTTWVYVEDRSADGIIAGIRSGRTAVSAQPPALGGVRLFLEADADLDGVWESMVGDHVRPGARFRARVEGGEGALLLLHGSDGTTIGPVPVDAPRFEHTFELPEGAAWVWAEVVREDARELRVEHCDPLVGGDTTYCRNRLLREAMTSGITISLAAPPATGPTYAHVADTTAVIGNGIVERRFSLSPFGTEAFIDRRTGFSTGATDDFRLTLAEGAELTGADLEVVDATSRRTPDGGLALTLRLRLGEPAAVASGAGWVERTYTTYPSVAGLRVQTTVAIPGVYTGYTLDEVAVPGAAPTAHHFNAGYDWRGSDTPDWEPTLAPAGGAHTGDHRETTIGAPGEAIDVTGQWLSLDAGGPRAFLVLERVNYDSSHVAYDGVVGRAHADLSDDLVYLGPFEADLHLDNPSPAPMRARVVSPGDPLALESVFTGLAVDADDEPWQHHTYLSEHRGSDWRTDVTFNSNGVDDGRISTGAKDDMDFEETKRQADIAERLGVETFILDDGWQAASGDWCPDSPECPEPRGMYPHRFPDDDFTAVREVLGEMELGLWMTPMHFNPAAEAYRENPEWACTPVGDGLAVYNTAEPNSSSNEAGLGTWNPDAVSREGRLIDYVEGRIRRAIEDFGATYFKFDFLVWIDCLDVKPATAYDYRESFVAMVDRLIASYPEVTFQIDETNDYRLFPFESTLRGPVWYANGNPDANEALHNLWVLAPYVPGYTIGQSTLTGQSRELGVDYLMAAALPSHLTFFRDLTSYTDAEIEQAAGWIELYKTHRDRFATLTYPLLDDPLPGDNWTALQPWDLDEQRGALLVFRQDAPDDTRSVALRGIRGGGDYRITDPRTGEEIGVFTAAQLRAGVDITLPARSSAAVWFVDPAN